MPNLNSYQLYVSNKCCSCDKVLAHLEYEKISIPTINVDSDEYHLPFTLTIFPALVKEKKLVGYGVDDIISCLEDG